MFNTKAKRQERKIAYILHKTYLKLLFENFFFSLLFLFLASLSYRGYFYDACIMRYMLLPYRWSPVNLNVYKNGKWDGVSRAGERKRLLVSYRQGDNHKHDSLKRRSSSIQLTCNRFILAVEKKKHEKIFNKCKERFISFLVI